MTEGYCGVRTRVLLREKCCEGTTDEIAATADDDVPPGRLVAGAEEHLLYAMRRAGYEVGVAHVQPSDVSGVEAVDVFLRTNRVRDTLLADVRWQGELDEDSMEFMVSVAMPDEGEERFLFDVFWQLEDSRTDAERFSRFSFLLDVRDRGRVFTDADQEQRRSHALLLQPFDSSEELCLDLRRDLMSGKDFCGQ